MKVLFISSQALFRNTRFGGAKRLYYLARELEQRTELHLICMDGAQEWPQEKPFTLEFARQLFVPFAPLKFTWRKALFLPGIREALSRHRAPINAFLEGQQFDATILAYPFSLRFLGRDRRRKMGKIVYLEDDLLLENFRKDGAQKKLGVKKLLKYFRHHQARHFFRRHMERVNSFVCISNQEEKIVRLLFPGLQSHVLKYGIPLNEYPLLPPPPKKNILGFIGNYHHKPNLDALNWLAKDLFPFILEKNHEARLLLAGKNFPSDFKEAFKKNPEIEIRENVENLEDFYGSIGVFINPLREGRGLRTKVVEAAAYGRHIISTPLGAEGLETLKIDICETPEEFWMAFSNFLLGKECDETIAQNRRIIMDEFSLASVGEQLMEILRA